MLAAAAVGTGWLWPTDADVAALSAVVVGHFFLFCNVFRVRRAYELAWAAAFAANVVAWVSVGRFSWGMVLLAQLPVTVAVIAAEAASDRYHGVGHGWLKRRRRAGAAGGAS